MNSAVMFVKPHANTSSCVSFVESELEKEGFKIISKREIKTEELENKIDEHYKNLSLAAMRLEACDLQVSPEVLKNFSNKFKESWDLCLSQGRILNANDYMNLTGIDDSSELLEEWDNKETIKFSLYDGVTIGCFKQIIGKNSFYILNAFYPALRSKFTQKTSLITAFIVEFRESEISWKTFRHSLIGPSSPEKAPGTAIRKKILDNWRKLGLKSRPDKSENGVHASAGALEGLRERLLWFSKDTDIETDRFGKELIRNGLTCEEIEDIVNDPELMEETKDLNTSDCINILKHKFLTNMD